MLDSMVVLKAGPTKTEFRVHRGLLCQISPYFRAALEGGFKEAEIQTIEWPEEKAETVKIFQLWLYSGSMDIDMGDSLSAWENLVDTYIFAEAYQLPALTVSVIDVFIQMKSQAMTVNIHVLARVYSTPSTKPLRKLLVDFAAHNWSLREKDFFREELLGLYPKQYLVDVVLELHDHDASRKWTMKEFKAARAKYSRAPTD